ncbi:MAG: hypothetical protein ACFFCW_18900 [Candidatus Hodarchaeota archaeon]
MKKILDIFLIFIFVLSIQTALGSDYEELQLKVPVRVFDKNMLINDLSKNDFRVSINNEDVEILSFESVSRRISHPTTPFRTFILAFNLYDYGEQVSEGIEYFVRDVLTDNDEIMIITPENMYKLLPEVQKDKTIDDIKRYVKKDWQIFKGKRTTYENTFKEKLKRIRPQMISRESALRFLNSYRSEWLTFKSRFLMPDVNEYKVVSQYLYGKEGDKWFINFQQREIIPELGELKKRIRDIRNFISSLAEAEETGWVPMLSKGVTELEKALLLSDRFPQEEIQDILLGLNISYNVILFKSKTKLGGSSPHESVSPDYEDILRNISRATGGFTLETTDIKNGLLQLSQHQDTSYLLNIPIIPTPLNIDIKLPKGNYETYHKKTYSGAEIKSIMQFSADKVKISGVSVKDKIVTFTISNFSTDQSQVSKSEGNLEVKMLVTNEKGEIMYRMTNTLKSFKDSIEITLPPLEHISGKNRVCIFTEDKITGISSIYATEFVF